jgi:hypothetical protein
MDNNRCPKNGQKTERMTMILDFFVLSVIAATILDSFVDDRDRD